mmetsp:Transcript_14322/g.25507  ORF Transcript_14322/g.25507 Transcript_14322/m.25507 type:complete len:158 (-) Transcript_14322:371-844(-)
MDHDQERPLYRPHTFMTINMNGWEAVEPKKKKGGAKVLRWHKLRMVTKAHGIEVLGIQEHHYKQQEGEGQLEAMQKLRTAMSRFTWIDWEMTATLADTPRSGVTTFWKKDKFRYVTHHQLDQRMLITILQDDDGTKWTIVNAHFHNDAGPRKQQWDK